MNDTKTKNPELKNLDLSENSTSKPMPVVSSITTSSKDTSRSILSKWTLLAGLLVGIFLFFLEFKILAILAVIVAAVLFFTLGLIKKSASLTKNTNSSEAISSEQKSLKNVLFGLQYLENIDSLGEKVFSQFELLEEKYKFYHKLLASKFSPGEITYQRYANAVDNIYQAISDNFVKLSNTLTVLSKMDIKDIQKAIKEEPSSSEKAVLEEQLTNYSKKMQAAKELLNLNQAAILQLEKLSFALNDIKSSQTSNEDDLKLMMKDLQELADRAHKYSL